MSLVDKVIEFITAELNIDISEENEKLITKKFYPDLKDKFYWSYGVDNSLYEGVVSREEYKKIKTLPPNTHIHFAEIAKYVNDECKLDYILPFTDDINKLKQFYDRGGDEGKNHFCLMSYFYDQNKLDYVEEDE
jgi:hypothetical protein